MISKRYNILLWLAIVLALLSLVLINCNAAYHNWRFDFTSDSYFSLSPKTKDVLKAVKHKGLKVKIYVLLDRLNAAYADTKILLQRYNVSDAVDVIYMDQDRDPAGTKAILDRLKIKENNIIVFECGQHQRFVKSTGLYEWSKRSPLDKNPAKVIGFRGEEVITSGIMSVSEDTPKFAYAVIGHDERSLSNTGVDGCSKFAQAILRANIGIKTIATLNAPKIPEDCNLLIINRPRSIFKPHEIKLLDMYLKRGGRLLLLMDAPIEIRPYQSANINLKNYFKKWGVTINNDLVIDSTQNLAGFGAGTLSAKVFGLHSVVKRMGNTPLIFSNARSIDLPTDKTAGKVQKDMDWTPLVRSSQDSWGEQDLSKLTSISKDAKDVQGPCNLAVSFSRLFKDAKGKATIARVFIIGSSVLASNRNAIGFEHSSNYDFLMNTVNYLTGREEVSGIGPRRPENVRLNLSRSQLKVIFILVMLIMPLLIALIGLIVWYFHRSKRFR